MVYWLSCKISINDRVSLIGAAGRGGNIGTPVALCPLLSIPNACQRDDPSSERMFKLPTVRRHPGMRRSKSLPESVMPCPLAHRISLCTPDLSRSPWTTFHFFMFYTDSRSTNQARHLASKGNLHLGVALLEICTSRIDTGQTTMSITGYTPRRGQPTEIAEPNHLHRPV